MQAGTDVECLAVARVAELDGQKKDMLKALRKLHVNLGHPSPSNLARVLKHGGASAAAIDLCREIQSSFQIMVSLEGRETSESIGRVLCGRWTFWAGIPQEIVLDPARANISDALTVPQELAGWRQDQHYGS